MEVKHSLKSQYLKPNTKENTRPILKDKNSWESKGQVSHRTSVISLECPDQKLTSPNSKRSSLTEEGLTFGDVTGQSNGNVSQELLPPGTNPGVSVQGIGKCCGSSCQNKSQQALLALVEKNQQLAQESQKKLKEREKELVEKMEGMEKKQKEETEKLKAEIKVLKKFDQFQKEIHDHQSTGKVGIQWMEKRLVKVREILVEEIQRVSSQSLERETFLRERVGELEQKLASQTALMQELVQKSETFGSQFKRSQEEWEKKESEYEQVISSERTKFQNEINKYHAELEIEKKRQKEVLPPVELPKDPQTLLHEQQIKAVLGELEEYKKVSEKAREGLGDRLQEVFMERENYALLMQKKVKHFEAKSIRLEAENKQVKAELGEYRKQSQEKMLVLERENQSVKKENIELGETFKEEVKVFVEQVIHKFEITKENIQEVSNRANYQLEQLQIFFKNDIQLKKSTEQEVLIEQLQGENQQMREQLSQLLEELQKQASPLVKGGVLQVKQQFEHLLNRLTSFSDTWAQERQDWQSQLTSLHSKLLEHAATANAKDQQDAQTIIDLSSQLQDSQFELRKLQNTDQVCNLKQKQQLIEEKRGLKQRCDQLTMQNRDLQEQVEQMARGYGKINEELQKLVKTTQTRKLDEVALKNLEIERLSSELALLEKSKASQEEHYLQKVNEQTLQVLERQEKLDELWVKFCRLNEIYKKKESQGVGEWQLRLRGIEKEVKQLHAERKDLLRQDEKNKLFKELQESVKEGSRQFKELSQSHSDQFQQEYEEQLRVMSIEISTLSSQKDSLIKLLEKCEFSYQQVVGEKKKVIGEFDLCVRQVNELVEQRVQEVRHQNQLLQEVGLMVTQQQEEQMQKVKKVIEDLVTEKDQLQKESLEVLSQKQSLDYYLTLEGSLTTLAQENALLQSQTKLLEDKVGQLEEELATKNVLFYEEKEILEKMFRHLQNSLGEKVDQSKLDKQLTFNNNVESLLSKIYNAKHIKDVKFLFREIQKAILYEKELIQIERKFTRLVRQEREERLLMQNKHLKQILEGLVLKVEVINLGGKGQGGLIEEEAREVRQILKEIREMESVNNRKLLEENERLTQILSNNDKFGHGKKIREMLNKSRKSSLDKSIINFSNVEGGQLYLKIASKQNQTQNLSNVSMMTHRTSLKATPKMSRELKRKKQMSKSVSKKSYFN